MIAVTDGSVEFEISMGKWLLNWLDNLSVDYHAISKREYLWNKLNAVWRGRVAIGYDLVSHRRGDERLLAS